MKELPDDLAVMGSAELAGQRALRDAQLEPLTASADVRGALRIATYLGRRRAGD